jgi:succinyl-CoA synthetase alpha subunit
MMMELFSVLMHLFVQRFEYSTFASTMDALKQPTIRVVAVIAEGVPEADTKKLIAYARMNNKVDD